MNKQRRARKKERDRPSSVFGPSLARDFGFVQRVNGRRRTTAAAHVTSHPPDSLHSFHVAVGRM